MSWFFEIMANQHIGCFHLLLFGILNGYVQLQEFLFVFMLAGSRYDFWICGFEFAVMVNIIFFLFLCFIIRFWILFLIVLFSG